VQIVHLTDIEVTHLAGSAHFGWQTASITRLRALQCHTLVQFLIQSFVYKAHAASARYADDTEPPT
jgi:hypothetical protein